MFDETSVTADDKGAVVEFTLHTPNTEAPSVCESCQ